MKHLAPFALTLLFPLMASAQQAIYVSGLLGVTHLELAGNSNSLDPDLSYGVRAGVLFTEHIALGVYWHQSHNDYKMFAADVSATHLMAELSYYVSGADENSLWFSGLLGSGQTTSSLLSVTESDLAMGLTLGYQFVLTPNFSLSPQLTYIHTDGSWNPVNQVSALMNLTAWF